MSKFYIWPTMPDAIMPLVDKYFLPLEWMIPAWCASVNLYFNAEVNESTALVAQVHFDYRFAEMWIHPLWLKQRDELKLDGAIHEMLHISINPMFDYAHNTIGTLLKDETLFKVHAQEDLRRICEGVTQDLADCIFKKLVAYNAINEKGREDQTRND